MFEWLFPTCDDESFADIIAKGNVNEPDMLSKLRSDTAGQNLRRRHVAQPLGAIPFEEGYAASTWRNKGVSERELGKLRKTNPCVKYDYHGDDRKKAFARLNEDLRVSLAAEHKVIEVVHGYGTGVLRNSMRGWLCKCTWVAAFTERVNNTGSVLVLLKRGG